ncbi:hypothetical protein [Peribacillus sp. Hz7]|uniref:hypothetical protein n=1 Tax=Peribacillus sp. Hz7 TaxID=3344873 RepID=UPI0035CAD924
MIHINQSSALDKMILEVRYETSNSTDLSETKLKNYQKIYELLLRKKAILDVSDFYLVFIGQKGIGKTTSILNLFNLIQNNQGLLSTAAGGTTVCEVEVKASNNGTSYYEIVPEEANIIQQYVDDFCASFQTEETNEILHVPSEVERFLRNMMGYKKKELQEKYTELADHKAFVQFVHDHLQLDARTETIVDCAYNDAKSYFASAMNIFKSINLGKIPTISIPKKIILHATNDIIDFDSYSFVRTLIDTRGIDGDGVDTDSFRREDILAYLDEKESESIYIIVDGFKPAPSDGILSLLKSRLRDKQHANKFYLLINVYNDEASEVMTDDGIAESVDEGIAYRKEDIISKFKQQQIAFSEDHILFYNAKQNEPSNEELIALIEYNLQQERQVHLMECEQAFRKFERIKYDFENKHYANENIEALKQKISANPITTDVLATLLSTFILEKLEVVHPSRLNAINRYNGHYSRYNFYHHLGLATEDAFNRLFNDSKKTIENTLQNIIEYRNLSEFEKFDYEMYLDEFVTKFADTRLSIREEVKDAILKQFQPKIWDEAYDEYGQGSSPNNRYKDRVFDYYREELIRILNDLDIQRRFMAGWGNTFNL